MSVVKLALVDDHPLVLHGLKSLLEKQNNFLVLFEASSGEEMLVALEKAQTLPDVIILDIKMRGITGIQVISMVRKQFPSIRVVIFSWREQLNTVTQIFSLGAVGYVSKTSDPCKLVNAILCVMNNERAIEHPDEKISLKSLNANSNKHPRLSERDLQFLTLCASELTYKEIADQLHVSPKTIDSQRDKLFTLLDIKSRVGLALYVMRNGLVE